MTIKQLSLLLGSSLGLVALFSGCASQPLPMNYAPSSVLTLSGTTSVGDFKYLPASDGKVSPNQVKNTALGSIKFDRNIDVAFKEAVFKELRFVGVKLDGSKSRLTGEIQEFLIDDLGYSVDWTLRVKYVLTEIDSGKTLYEESKETKRKTNKFANVFGALNETIKLNIEDLMKDSKFAEAIK